jgi:hypothetical protein
MPPDGVLAAVSTVGRLYTRVLTGTPMLPVRPRTRDGFHR